MRVLTGVLTRCLSSTESLTLMLAIPCQKRQALQALLALSQSQSFLGRIAVGHRETGLDMIAQKLERTCPSHLPDACL